MKGEKKINFFNFAIYLLNFEIYLEVLYAKYIDYLVKLPLISFLNLL